MVNEGENNEEKKYIKTLESIITNLYTLKETEKQYLNILNNLLNYWTNESKKAGLKDEKRQDKILEFIKREKDTIKKINEDIDKINTLIDETEKRFEKIRKMATPP
ncbi:MULTISPECIES: hypothetical protein [Methanobacterium]|uniref:Uncharacterized protein n=1 Tax=Methanobacterium bryantii TaxID=2161 RepID=A0A2A2H6T4_METBR|nr:MULTISPECIES: hypothetical protein [Methanobacterium]OEC84939.1 hypothetical protein A9507_01000 [Methanobacterium sp. A39]PAV05088.1 hypothetical protein ASJ80_12420 [Methanobacterium bryantii]